MEFSVAIRTYNRAQSLRLVLDALQDQVETDRLEWEIVLIDNNSTDNTATLVQQHYAHWPPNITFRYVLETRQGAAIARRRAIQEAQSPLIGFLDDDNVPSPNWVIAAYNFAQTHPQVAAFGGKSLPIFESPPPPGFEALHPYLALIDRGEIACPYNPKVGVLPPGAGLVIRRQVWLDHVPTKFTLQGPTKTLLPTKGEDIESLIHLAKAGHEIWYAPSLVLHHHIPTHRLQPEYLIHLCHTIGCSSHILRMLRFDSWQRPPMILLYLCNDYYRWLRHTWGHRHYRNDFISQCQAQKLVGHLESPFRQRRRF
jgi:glycosyltransferase involved in cell wall biosynthesis